MKPSGASGVNSRIIHGVVVSILAWLVCGCAPGIDAQKRASMDQAQVHHIAGVEINAFAMARTAVLLTGADEVTNLMITKNEVRGSFRLKGKVCKTIGGCASVPIDERGYWLTASHCLDNDAALIYMPSASGEQQAVLARIVWKGDRPGQDIALLYAPLRDGIVPVDVSHAIRVSARIICVGSGIAADPLSAGRVIGSGGATDGSLTWLEHDAPLTAGDSGGPAFYDDGVLAGINVEAGTSASGKIARAMAIQPSMDEIAQLIEEDWRRQSASH